MSAMNPEYSGPSKGSLARVALNGAIKAVLAEHPAYTFEVFQNETLFVQLRMTGPGMSAPRYFTIRVSEPI